MPRKTSAYSIHNLASTILRIFPARCAALAEIRWHGKLRKKCNFSYSASLFWIGRRRVRSRCSKALYSLFWPLKAGTLVCSSFVFFSAWLVRSRLGRSMITAMTWSIWSTESPRDLSSLGGVASLAVRGVTVRRCRKIAMLGLSFDKIAFRNFCHHVGA